MFFKLLYFGVFVLLGLTSCVTQDGATNDTQASERVAVRIATFNVSMNRRSAGELADALVRGEDEQIQAVARAIQRVRPDIVLLNEFDQVYSEGRFNRTATVAAIDDFRKRYLAIAQAPHAAPIEYPHFYVSPSNTGVPSGMDLNNDGDTAGPQDAHGFGAFPGQYAMVLLSKYPLQANGIRTFQHFLWRDMPRALLPPDPADSDDDGNTASYYSDAELDVLRLSSKTHWDIPVDVPGIGVVHVLASHPTPPVFDDGAAETYPATDVVDWNGLRNHDEIRFWADYIDPQASGYIYDDIEWIAAGNRTPVSPSGGLRDGERFVILGDQNADPDDGDATFNPIRLLLDNERIDTSITPQSEGAREYIDVGSNRATKTSSFKLRADYALPSVAGWRLVKAWVYWPRSDDAHADVLDASDHRMVIVEMAP